jgi:hypothetical protein
VCTIGSGTNPTTGALTTKYITTCTYLPTPLGCGWLPNKNVFNNLFSLIHTQNDNAFKGQIETISSIAMTLIFCSRGGRHDH